jgi:hypothetical protein
MSDPEINNDKSLISLWHHGVLPGSYVRLLNSGTNHEHRPFDLCLVGHTDKVFYPLRAKMEKWIKNGNFSTHGIISKQLDHFGYTEQLSAEEKVLQNISAAGLEIQYLDFITFLSKCKTAVASRSIRDYDLKKYIEFAMAGVLMIGDVPTEVPQKESWSKFVIDIHNIVMADQFEEVVGKIKLWLSDGCRSRRQQAILDAQTFMFSQRTAQHAWSIMREAYFLYKVGNRGFIIPNGLE